MPDEEERRSPEKEYPTRGCLVANVVSVYLEPKDPWNCTDVWDGPSAIFPGPVRTAHDDLARADVLS
jgi:hypothetical protein